MLFSLCPANPILSYCDLTVVLGEGKWQYIILPFKLLNEPSLSYPETDKKATWTFRIFLKD